jgi:hypothetical protein
MRRALAEAYAPPSPKKAASEWLYTTYACGTTTESGTKVWGATVGILELTAIFVFGFVVGYGTREIISRRRRKAAQSTFIYPE